MNSFTPSWEPTKPMVPQPDSFGSSQQSKTAFNVNSGEFVPGKPAGGMSQSAPYFNPAPRAPEYNKDIGKDFTLQKEAATGMSVNVQAFVPRTN